MSRAFILTNPKEVVDKGVGMGFNYFQPMQDTLRAFNSFRKFMNFKHFRSARSQQIVSGLHWEVGFDR